VVWANEHIASSKIGNSVFIKKSPFSALNRWNCTAPERWVKPGIGNYPNKLPFLTLPVRKGTDGLNVLSPFHK